MKFINLEKLKIVQSHNFHSKEITIELDSSDSLIDMRNKVRPLIQSLFIDVSKLETVYVINLESDPIQTLEDADNYFQTMVNALSGMFFQEFCLPQRRSREYRLDVPENLKELYVNLSSLKKAVNYETKNDVFALEINWDNNEVEYHYNMMPEAK